MTTTYNFTKKDTINATSNSVPLQTAPETITIRAAAVIDNVPDNDGEVKTVGYMVATDGTVYGTISDTAIRGIYGIIDFMTDDSAEVAEITVNHRQSKGGRTFIALTIN